MSLSTLDEPRGTLLHGGYQNVSNVVVCDADL
jgi:hypothetical protein